MAKLIGRRYQYTKDYKTTPYLGPNGREEKRLVYVGKWINPLNDEAELKRIVLVSRLLVAASLTAFIFAMFILPPPTEGKWFLLPLVTAVFPLAYEVMAAFRLPNKKEKMERINFDKSFIRLKHSSVICIVMVLLSALGLIIYWALVLFGVFEPPAPFAAGDALYALGVAALAAASFIIYRQMKLVRTEELENTTML